MRKFKLFFYPVYLIVAFLVLYYSIDILANMDVYKEKVDFTMLRKLPFYLLYLLLTLSLLMIAELITENFHLIKLRGKVKQAKEEVLKLKAKLYDQSQEEDVEDEPNQLPEEFEDEDEDENVEDEDRKSDW